MTRAIKRTLALGLLPVGLALVAAGCGGGDDGGAEAPSLEQWQARASQFCSDGTQEAVALVPPTTGAEVGSDAAAMAEIVVVTLDGISPLAPPDDEDAQALISRYLGELSTDADVLLEVSETAAAGGDYLEPLAQLDESAGQVALELGLDECAAFANAVARTP